MALAVDAVVGRREDAVDLSECGDCLVEVQAKCDEVVDRGLRDSSPGADSDDLRSKLHKYAKDITEQVDGEVKRG